MAAAKRNKVPVGLIRSGTLICLKLPGFTSPNFLQMTICVISGTKLTRRHSIVFGPTRIYPTRIPSSFTASFKRYGEVHSLRLNPIVAALRHLGHFFEQMDG
mmetsp:Transcript_45045/g.66899  ORF Transcript_45045/g.66899 Transcript_45045/m.66899 type:complete len:102 (+) Transcript_45045:320-625(+)